MAHASAVLTGIPTDIADTAVPIDTVSSRVPFQAKFSFPGAPADLSCGAKLCSAVLALYRYTWYVGPLRNLAMPLASLWLLSNSPWCLAVLPIGYRAMQSPWKQIWDKSNPEALRDLNAKLFGAKRGEYGVLKRIFSPVLALSTAAALGEGARKTYQQVFDGALENCFKVDLKKPQSDVVQSLQEAFFWIAIMIGILTVTPQFLLYIGHVLDKAKWPKLSCQTAADAGYSVLTLVGLAVALTACTGNYFFGKEVAKDFFGNEMKKDLIHTHWLRIPDFGEVVLGVASSVGPYFLNLDADWLWKKSWWKGLSHLEKKDYMLGFGDALISGCAGVFPALYGNLKDPTFGSKPAAIFFIFMAFYYNVAAKIVAEYNKRNADAKAAADEGAGRDLIYLNLSVSQLSLASYEGQYVYSETDRALVFVTKEDSVVGESLADQPPVAGAGAASGVPGSSSPKVFIAKQVLVADLVKSLDQLKLVLEKRKEKITVSEDGSEQVVRIAGTELTKIGFTQHESHIERSATPPAGGAHPPAGSPDDDLRAPLLGGGQRPRSYGSGSSNSSEDSGAVAPTTGALPRDRALSRRAVGSGSEMGDVVGSPSLNTAITPIGDALRSQSRSSTSQAAQSSRCSIL